DAAAGVEDIHAEGVHRVSVGLFERRARNERGRRVGVGAQAPGAKRASENEHAGQAVPRTKRHRSAPRVRESGAGRYIPSVGLSTESLQIVVLGGRVCTFSTIRNVPCKAAIAAASHASIRPAVTRSVALAL